MGFLVDVLVLHRGVFVHGGDDHGLRRVVARLPAPYHPAQILIVGQPLPVLLRHQRDRAGLFRQAVRHHRRKQRFLLAVVAAIGEIQIEIGDFQKKLGTDPLALFQTLYGGDEHFQQPFDQLVFFLQYIGRFHSHTSHKQVGSRQRRDAGVWQSRHASRCRLVGSA